MQDRRPSWTGAGTTYGHGEADPRVLAAHTLDGVLVDMHTSMRTGRQLYQNHTQACSKATTAQDQQHCQ